MKGYINARALRGAAEIAGAGGGCCGLSSGRAQRDDKLDVLTAKRKFAARDSIPLINRK